MHTITYAPAECFTGCHEESAEAQHFSAAWPQLQPATSCASVATSFYSVHSAGSVEFAQEVDICCLQASETQVVSYRKSVASVCVDDSGSHTELIKSEEQSGGQSPSTLSLQSHPQTQPLSCTGSQVAQQRVHYMERWEEFLQTCEESRWTTADEQMRGLERDSGRSRSDVVGLMCEGSKRLHCERVVQELDNVLKHIHSFEASLGDTSGYHKNSCKPFQVHILPRLAPLCALPALTTVVDCTGCLLSAECSPSVSLPQSYACLRADLL